MVKIFPAILLNYKNVLWLNDDLESIVFFMQVVLNATTISCGIKRTAQETTGGML